MMFVKAPLGGRLVDMCGHGGALCATQADVFRGSQLPSHTGISLHKGPSGQHSPRRAPTARVPDRAPFKGPLKGSQRDDTGFEN